MAGFEIPPVAVDFFYKMIICEKIQYSSDKAKFRLFKEGLFYKCYNEDAMVFAKRVKNYKISAKYVKSAGSVFHMEPKKIKKEFGKDICFRGAGCDTSEVLNSYSPEKFTSMY